MVVKIKQVCLCLKYMVQYKFVFCRTPGVQSRPSKKDYSDVFVLNFM